MSNMSKKFKMILMMFISSVALTLAVVTGVYALSSINQTTTGGLQFGKETYPLVLNIGEGATLSGDEINSYTYSSTSAFALPDSSYATKTGYTFAGWYENQDLTGQAVTSIPAKTRGTKTFYAKWDTASIVVTLDPNGGNVSPTSLTVKYNSTYGTLPTPTRTGYTFDGWYTSPSGGEEVTSSTTVTNASAHTLYAHWTENAGYLHSGWKSKIPNVSSLTSIEFTNTKPTTGTAIQIGATKENSTAYWAEGNTSCFGVYAYVNGTQLTIYSPGIIYAPKDSSYLFSSLISSLTNLTSITFNNIFDTSLVTNMSRMFSSCSALTTLDLSGFDTSKVTNMLYMFNNCSQLTTLDLRNFDTSLVTNMSYMFNNCSQLTTLDLSGFNTSSVTDMSYMFNNCSKLTTLDLSGFNTSKVTNMRTMFQSCSALTTLDLRNFNTSNVTSMSSMFYSCSALTTLNLSNFNTSLVTNMSSMFYSCSALTTLDLSSFDTSLVTNMSDMFRFCSPLTTLDLRNFNTSNVTNMRYMFSDCSKLTTLDLRNFNTSKVTNMSYMFSNCSELTTLDLSSFDTSKVTNATSFLSDCSALTTIHTPKIVGTTALPLPSTNSFYTVEDTPVLCPSITSEFANKTIAKGITVTLNANGGSVSPTTIIVFKGQTYGTLPTPTRTGHTFDGWYTSASGGEKVTSSTTVTNPSAHTLYARWEIVSYIVEIDENGGDSVTNPTYTINTTDQTVEIPIPFYANFVFNNWDINWGAGQHSEQLPSLISNTQLKIPANCYGDIVLIAQWTPAEARIDSVYYVTFEQAMNDAADSDTVAIVAPSITIENTQFIYKNRTIISDVNTTIYYTNTSAPLFVVGSENLDFTSLSTSTVKIGSSSSYKITFDGRNDSYSESVIINAATLYMENVEFTKFEFSPNEDIFATCILNGHKNYLTNVSIQNNILNSGSAVLVSMPQFTNSGEEIIISNSTFSHNYLSDNSYVFYFETKANILDCTISNNDAKGVVLWFDGNATVNGGKIEANKFSCLIYNSGELTLNTNITSDNEKIYNGSAEGIIACLSPKIIVNGGTYNSIGDLFTINGTILEIEINGGTFYGKSISTRLSDLNNFVLNNNATLGDVYVTINVGNDNCLIDINSPNVNLNSIVVSGSDVNYNNTPLIQFSDLAYSLSYAQEILNKVSVENTNYVAELNATNKTIYISSKSFTLNYDSNGSGEPNLTQKVYYNQPFTTKPSETFTRIGYTFVGWSTNASAWEGDYKDADKSYTYNQTKSITLYAIWRENAGYLHSGWKSKISNVTLLTSIEFTNTQPTTGTPIQIGATDENSTAYWAKGNTSCFGVYGYVDGTELTIYSPGIIYAPKNSSYLFSSSSFSSRLTNLTSITFNNVFDTSLVTDMSGMFNNCNLLTELDVSSFNTSLVTNMSSMFYSCSKLTTLNLNSFNTSNVTNMSNMFYNCSNLTTLDLSDFNTSNVTNMSYMFHSCSALTTLDLSGFDTSKVTSMSSMFSYCSQLTTLDLRNFDTSKVTNMSHMFNNCIALTELDVSTFNTSLVTDMLQMFYYCSGLESITFGDNFNTSLVTNMSWMFSYCSALTTLDLSGFDTSLVTSATDFLTDCGALTTIHTPKIVGSVALELPFDDFYTLETTPRLCESITSSFQGVTIKRASLITYNITYVTNGATWVSGYTAPQSYNMANSLTLPTSDKLVYSGYVFEGWYTTSSFTGNAVTSIPAGSYGNKIYYARWTENASYLHRGWQSQIPNVTSLTSIEFTNTKPTTGTPIQIGATNENSTAYWSEGNTSCFGVYAYVDGTKLTIYSPATIYAPKNSSYLFSSSSSSGQLTNLTSITFNNIFDTSSVTSMYYMFASCSQLTTLDLSSFDTSLVTNMSYMFYYCIALTELDVSNFDTSLVTDMSYMFNDCKLLTTLDVSSFNTSSVIDMSRMFQSCSALTTLDVSSFNTSSVTDMPRMFYYCSALTELDLSSFDTTNVTTMYAMFAYCGDLTELDLSSFNTSSVTDMSQMFDACSALTTLDLSSFDTSKVTDMSYMFHSCSALTTLDLSSFNTSLVTDMCAMFHSCSALTTLDVSSFNTSKVTDMPDMFYKCSKLTELDLSSFDTSLVTSATYFLTGCSALTTIHTPKTVGSVALPLPFNDFYTLETPPRLCKSIKSAFQGVTIKRASLITYNITYVTNGATWVSGYTAPQSYNMANSLTLPTSDKLVYSGYVFEGWYTTSSFTGNAVTSIPAGSYGNKTYYARWRENASYLHSDWKDKISNASSLTSIEFTNAQPTTGTPPIQIGATDENSTAYWSKGNTSCFGVYAYVNGTQLTIYSPGIIYAPKNSNNLFGSLISSSRLTNLTSIIFNNIFDTSLVTDMSYMFHSCSALTTLDLSSFNTSLVTDMCAMFNSCIKLTTLDVSSFDTSKVTNMRTMFQSCSALTTLDLSSFDTSSVTDMSYMFHFCRALTELDVSSFNTSNVTSMSGMFSSCSKLTTLNLSNFDTSLVTNMSGMFSYCSGLESITFGDNFDTSFVTNMQNMFFYCSKLATLDLSSFNIKPRTNVSAMLSSCDLLKTIVSPATVAPSVNLDTATGVIWVGSSNKILYSNLPGSNITLDAGAILAPNWQDVVTTTGITSYVFQENSSTLGTDVGAGSLSDTSTYYYDTVKANIDGSTMYIRSYFKIFAPQNSGGLFSNLNGRITFTNFDTSQVTNMNSMFAMSSFSSLNLSSFNTAKVTVMSEMFAYFTGTSSLSLTNFNTANVTTMQQMFSNCKASSINLSSFNTSKVTNMQGMFNYAGSLKTLTLSTNFKTSNVTNMSSMFSETGLTSLSFNTSFNTSKVTNMGSMFSGCSKLTSLTFNSNFNTSNVTYMGYMFSGCSALKSISFGTNFKTTNVTNMSYMFSGCSALKSISLSGFNTAKVTDMSYMFNYCSGLTSISLSSFNTAKVTNMSYMFNGCSGLTTLSLTSFSLASITSNQKGFIDGCSNLNTINTPSTISRTVGLDISTAPKRYRKGGIFTPRVTIINNSVVNVEIHSY